MRLYASLLRPYASLLRLYTPSSSKNHFLKDFFTYFFYTFFYEFLTFFSSPRLNHEVFFRSDSSPGALGDPSFNRRGREVYIKIFTVSPLYIYLSIYLDCPIVVMIRRYDFFGHLRSYLRFFFVTYDRSHLEN
jgi:hypothetical protein